MGMMTDLAIASWQEEHGIEPARGERAKLLREISELAFDLIKIIELEQSGIRDGNGRWHGSDPVHGTMRDMVKAFEKHEGLVEQEWRNQQTV
jgi:hypothetical protein